MNQDDANVASAKVLRAHADLISLYQEQARTLRQIAIALMGCSLASCEHLSAASVRLCEIDEQFDGVTNLFHASARKLEALSAPAGDPSAPCRDESTSS